MTKEEKSKLLRQIKGLYQLSNTEFSKKMGIPLSTLQSWLSGRVEINTLKFKYLLTMVEEDNLYHDGFLVLHKNKHTPQYLFKHIRNACGVTREELAALIENPTFTKDKIERWERGTTKIQPEDLEVLKKLAESDFQLKIKK